MIYLSTVSEELIHFKQFQSRGLLNDARVNVNLFRDQFEAEATNALLNFGFK